MEREGQTQAAICLERKNSQPGHAEDRRGSKIGVSSVRESLLGPASDPAGVHGDHGGSNPKPLPAELMMRLGVIGGISEQMVQRNAGPGHLLVVRPQETPDFGYTKEGCRHYVRLDKDGSS